MQEALVRRLVRTGINCVARSGAWDSRLLSPPRESTGAPAPPAMSKPPTHGAGTQRESPARILSSEGGRKRLERPGCTAADDVLVVKGHLEGLVEGKRGWPILSKDSPGKLEEAALGSEQMGDAETASRLRALAKRLPDVRDVPAARQALEELAPLRDATWELARRCGGGGISPELLAKVQDLAQAVKDGKMTREEAVRQIKAAGPERS